MLKFTTIIFLSLTLIESYAQNFGCENVRTMPFEKKLALFEPIIYSTVETELQTKGYIIPKCLKEHFNFLSQYDISILLQQPEIFLMMINCEEPGIRLEVAVHEATHLSDLGMNLKEIETANINEAFPNFSLTLTENESAPMPYKKLPAPKDLVMKRLQEAFPEGLRNTDSLYNGFLKEYLLDDTTLAANNFLYGFATELNAYIKGLPIETKTRAEINGKKYLAQRDGILFYLGLYKAYLQQLKKDNPVEFLEISNNKQITFAINRLFINANIALAESGFPNKDVTDEPQFVKAFNSLGSNEELKPFIEVKQIEKLEKLIKLNE